MRGYAWNVFSTCQVQAMVTPVFSHLVESFLLNILITFSMFVLDREEKGQSEKLTEKVSIFYDIREISK